MIAQTIIVASCLAATATAFGPAFPAVALTLGTNPGTALILSSAQVTLAAAAIAGLAIAKEALTLAAVADSKRGGGRSASRHHHHKREVTPLDFSQMFEGVDAQDSADCGKLLVCHSVAKPEAIRSHEEQAIADLFEASEPVQANAYGKYQWAAYAGTFKNPQICAERYSSCPVNPQSISRIVSSVVYA